MAFNTGYLGDPQRTGGGERYGDNVVVLAATTFEDGLKVGRFAKLDAGSIDNLDGSATPVVAGVVLRNVAAPVEAGASIDATLTDHVNYVRAGLVTVEVKEGEEPEQFAPVFASNEGDADDGLALADGDVETGAEFIREEKPGVWLVRLK
jgi:hypothetical protein